MLLDLILEQENNAFLFQGIEVTDEIGIRPIIR